MLYVKNMYLLKDKLAYTRIYPKTRITHTHIFIDNYIEKKKMINLVLQR